MGYGDLGSRCARYLTQLGLNVRAVARTDKPSPGLTLRLGDLSDQKVLDREFDEKPHYVVMTMTPAARSVQAYYEAYYNNVSRLMDAIARSEQPPALVIFVSSTSVYHQSDGEWVTELSDVLPTPGSTANVLLETENLLRSGVTNHCIVRFSGIYGPGRFRLLKAVAAGKGGGSGFTNRVHAEDCARVLAFVVEKHLSDDPVPSLLLASDDRPVVSHEVRCWLAKQMGFPKEHLQFPLQHQADSHRRCANERLKRLGFKFLYPDFESGYPALIEAFLRHR